MKLLQLVLLIPFMFVQLPGPFAMVLAFWFEHPSATLSLGDSFQHGSCSHATAGFLGDGFSYQISLTSQQTWQIHE